MNDMQMPALPPIKGLVRLERCERCKWAAPAPDENPMPECRLNPPSASGLVIGRQANGQPAIITFTAFPRVHPEQWCGQWKAKIEVHQ